MDGDLSSFSSDPRRKPHHLLRQPSANLPKNVDRSLVFATPIGEPIQERLALDRKEHPEAEVMPLDQDHPLESVLHELETRTHHGAHPFQRVIFDTHGEPNTIFGAGDRSIDIHRFLDQLPDAHHRYFNELHLTGCGSLANPTISSFFEFQRQAQQHGITIVASTTLVYDNVKESNAEGEFFAFTPDGKFGRYNGKGYASSTPIVRDRDLSEGLMGGLPQCMTNASSTECLNQFASTTNYDRIAKSLAVIDKSDNRNDVEQAIKTVLETPNPSTPRDRASTYLLAAQSTNDSHSLSQAMVLWRQSMRELPRQERVDVLSHLSTKTEIFNGDSGRAIRTALNSLYAEAKQEMAPAAHLPKSTLTP